MRRYSKVSNYLGYFFLFFFLLRLFLMILGNEMDLVNREKISKSVNVCKKNTEQIKQPSIN